MYTILTTPTFDAWFSKLNDSQARARIQARITRAEDGNLGDHKSVGGGVAELRLTHGPGYRIYYTLRGLELIVLLVGGDKSTQTKDIEKAKELLQTLEEST
jgi:putative addiction module killer protein